MLSIFNVPCIFNRFRTISPAAAGPQLAGTELPAAVPPSLTRPWQCPTLEGRRYSTAVVFSLLSVEEQHQLLFKLVWRTADTVFAPSGLSHKQLAEHADHQCTALLKTVLLVPALVPAALHEGPKHTHNTTCTYTHLQLHRAHHAKQRDKHFY